MPEGTRPLRESQLILAHRKKWLKAHPKDYYHKIADSLGVGGPKPFDVFILGYRTDSTGKQYKEVWAKEFKIHKVHTAFPLRNIVPHQISELVMAEQGGATATVFIGVRFMLDVDTQKRVGLRLRQISVDIEIPIQDIVELVKSGQKSIPILPILLEEINGEPRSEALRKIKGD